MLGGIYKVQKGKKKKGDMRKKGKKRKPVTVNSKVFIRKKEGKECLLPKQRKTPFLSLKNEILVFLVSQEIRSTLASIASLIS